LTLPLAHHHEIDQYAGTVEPGSRRTHVVRIFPIRRAPAVGSRTGGGDENWLEAIRYLNMDHLNEHKKQMMRQAA
jgi:putative transposase